ncbi:hypothetical protein [Epibacterium sp. Ofav1-8]|uniref:hypothetical protein n=1 Tax=Epibacterium sp. Ofav1-8 TaxID=2917735 RepID=UPI001EF5C5DB|nr:hypothetical protein [Epibacterium sp. Ofav1-8]MCG7624395.1 hypothetical protein [Epibacterium sp. Ofav1-8]
MSIPGFSPFPEIPQRSTPEADFDAKMYALFQHFATTHRNELLAFIEFLENNSTVIDAALNGTTIGLTDPAAAKFTTLEADSIGGAAVQANATDASDDKLLKVGAGGILATNPPNLADPAQLDAPAGLYSIAASDGWPFDGALLQLRRNAGRGVQIAARGSSSAPNASSEILVRTSGNSFGGWARLIHAENLLGTVSQSGGTPTGAVIERGSNANGEYVRFADGTQICRRQAVPDYSSQNTRQQFSYAATFADLAEVWCGYSIQGNGNTAAWDAADGLFVFGGLAAAQWEVIQRKSGQPDSGYPINLIAYGRWF